jgi:hypothetical protein
MLELVKKPSWAFFIIHLSQQGGIIQCRANMNKSGCEKGHPDRDVDNVPDGQQPAGTRQ